MYVPPKYLLQYMQYISVDVNCSNKMHIYYYETVEKRVFARYRQNDIKPIMTLKGNNKCETSSVLAAIS